MIAIKEVSGSTVFSKHDERATPFDGIQVDSASIILIRFTRPVEIITPRETKTKQGREEQRQQRNAGMA